MSLSEVLIAIVIIGLLLLPVGGYMGIGLHNIDDSLGMVTATNLAQKEIARVIEGGSPGVFTDGRYQIHSQINGEFIEVQVSWGQGSLARQKTLYGFIPNNSY